MHIETFSLIIEFDQRRPHPKVFGFEFIFGYFHHTYKTKYVKPQ